ncbi:hypothetical protein ABZT28_25955 [Streptomyces sp. NPDC005388]|uniref:hypothetical protein n=1 Tax=Streptomyces sp. NPDC005388 TaxID=3156717 RepID=UPI0033AFDD33
MCKAKVFSVAVGSAAAMSRGVPVTGGVGLHDGEDVLAADGASGGHWRRVGKLEGSPPGFLAVQSQEGVETTLIASTVESDEEWGVGRRWLLSTGRQAPEQITYPFLVTSAAKALVDDTWYTYDLRLQGHAHMDP